MSEGIFRAADALLVPTIPTTLSLRTLEQLRTHLPSRGPHGLIVLPFFCMVDRRKSSHREIRDLRSTGPFLFLDASIAYSSVAGQMSRERRPVHEFAPDSPVARSCEQLWSEVMSRTGSLFGWVGRWMHRRPTSTAGRSRRAAASAPSRGADSFV